MPAPVHHIIEDMKEMQTHAFRKIMSIQSSLLLGVSCAQLALPLAGYAQAGDAIPATAQPPALMIAKYVTWWSHAATGYHPAIYIQYENDSGHDLSGQLIKFQCRFTDLRRGYVTVARQEVKTALPNTRSQRAIFRGPTPFELSIDENLWPTIECKVMSRIGESGDEGTQDLLICRLDAVTMTDDEALERLEKQDDIRRGKYMNPPKPKSNAPEKPLAATMPLLKLNSQNPDKNQPGKSSKVPTIDFSLSGKLPGLGDDFFEFEQAFGRPIEYDPSSGRWTWVHYRAPDSSDVFVGARHPNSKADVIVTTLHTNKPFNDTQIGTVGRLYAGKYKAQPLGSVNHTVRYLATGRVQVTTMASSTYHLSIYGVGDPRDGNYTIILSRLPGTIESTMIEQIKLSRLLSFLKPVLGDSEQN